MEASKILTRTTCAKCKSVIEIFQESISWIGPNSPHLISLWRALPAPNAEMLELGGGFTASQMPNGTSIADHLDHKVALLTTAEGLTVHLHHHNEGGKLSILLDGAGFSVIEQGRS